MDEPAPKRRKTASPEERERASSPLKQPPRRPSFAFHTNGGAERPRSPLKEPPRRPSVSPTKATFDRAASPLRKPPRRPSFASPTKASLARNYPNLLPPRPSSSGSTSAVPHSRADILARGTDVRAFVLGDKGTRPSSRGDPVNGGDEVRPRAQNPQIVTPRAQRTKAQTAAIATDDAEEEEEDADLPLTPSQRAIGSHDTPRRGIMYSSPSKRPPRLVDSVKKSPLRPKAPAVRERESGRHMEESLRDVESTGSTGKAKEGPDPELEARKREKERLERELKELENDISRCTEEIVKIQEQGATAILQPAEREDLIAFVNKISGTGTEAEESHPPTISSLLCSFLPFSTRTVPLPKPRQPQIKPVASHRPLELDDPLPYIEMFTDIEISTQLSLPRGRIEPSSDRVHQKHIIDLTGPLKLLTASVSIVIDTLTNTIIELKILRLSPWAERDLGIFMRSRALEKDLGNACWAIGSYWTIAKKRAEYWHKCELAFKHLLAGRTSDDAENISQGPIGKVITRKDINRHLGRDTLVLQDRHVLLKVSWKVSFDWTGEAESEIGVESAVPLIWTEADSNNSLKKIPETFSSLLQSKGAFAATKTMVALLFAE